MALENPAPQQLEQIVRTNHRREQDLAAQCARYEIEHKEKVDEMAGAARVQEIEVQSRMDVLVGQRQGDLQVATAEGAKEAEVIVQTMSIECERRKVKVMENAGVEILASEAKLKAAQNNSQALIAEATLLDVLRNDPRSVYRKVREQPDYLLCLDGIDVLCVWDESDAVRVVAARMAPTAALRPRDSRGLPGVAARAET